MSSNYETIVVDRPCAGVGRIALNRPKSLNALSRQLQQEFAAAAHELDADAGIGAILVTGSERAFAAGADIAEMVALSYVEVERSDLFAGWDSVANLRTPLVAAVSGHALGGGAELVMICDIVVASTTATFGQPEIKLGILPGIGGTQRLTRAVGKAKAMDLCLTGRTMDVEEAERTGLVSRVVAPELLEAEALDVARTVATMSRSAVVATKSAIDRSFEMPLAEGIRYERLAFTARFASPDRTEGMTAFLEKRPPRYAAHGVGEDGGGVAGD